MNDEHLIAKTIEFEYEFDDIMDDLEEGNYKYSVAAINYYGESLNSNEILVNVDCFERQISNQVYDEHKLEEGCSIKMNNIEVTNNSYLFVNPREEFEITSDFAVGLGCYFEVNK